MATATPSNVELHTDASYDRKTGKTGIAYIVVVDGKIVVEHSQFLKYTKSSNYAEFKAILFGLRYVESMGLNIGRFTIRCDCCGALDKVNVILWKSRLRAKWVEVKHIKGHSDGQQQQKSKKAIKEFDEEASRHNRWCDWAAKRALKEGRKNVGKVDGRLAI